MLGKLLKYEFKASYREFLGLYAALFLCVLLTWTMNNPVLELVGNIASMVLFALVVATLVVTFVNIIKSFNKRFYGREGYLNLTLPASIHTQVSARMISSILWCIFTGLAIMIAVFLLFVIHNDTGNIMMFWRELGNLMNALWENNLVLTVVLFLIAMLTTVTQLVTSLFFGCAVAHLSVFRKFRVPVGILSVFAFSWLANWIVQVMSWGINPWGVTFVWGETTMLSDIVGSINTSLAIAIPVTLAFAAIQYILVTYILKRHLEVE